jgi:uncharacterized alpha-E superfamily protein
VELLVLDQQNPRSVAYQLARVRGDLRALPASSPTAPPLGLLDALVETVGTADPTGLAGGEDGQRPVLEPFLADLHGRLRALGEAVQAQYQQQQPTQQLLPRPGAAEPAGARP